MCKFVNICILILENAHYNSHRAFISLAFITPKCNAKVQVNKKFIKPPHIFDAMVTSQI